MTDPVSSFRAAEGRLLRRHGLEARERLVPLARPAMPCRLLEAGEGTPTLYVHGGGACGALWASLAARLPGRRHVMPDRPGFGLTERVDLRGLDFRRHSVDFLASLLDALAIDRCDVIANSMGGLWSLWLALDHPELVARLTLLGAPAMVGGGSAPLPMRLLGRPLIGPLMMKLEPPSPGQVRTLWKRMGHDPTSVDDEVHALMLALERLPAYGPAWRGLMGRILRLGGPVPDVVFADEDLAKLSCPVHYLWGASDPFGDAAFGRRVADLTPGCRFDEIGTGHLPWLDALDECARRIREAEGAPRAQVVARTNETVAVAR